MSLGTLDPELLANPVAVLATAGHDGYPQLTAVWYIVEHDRICASITESTRKAKNIRLNPRCSLLIFHPDTSDYFVEIRGEASIQPDDDYEFADRLGARYNADMRRFDGPEAQRLRISIEGARILTTDVR